MLTDQAARPAADAATMDDMAARSADAFPLVVHDLDGFQSYHPASFEAVRAVVPSGVLHPLRLPDGRALLAFVVTRKRTVTVGSGPSSIALPAYADLVISAMVTREPLSRVGSSLALAGLGRRRIGAFVLHVPLTSRALRDPGRSMLGMPMFVADLDFEESEEWWRLRVSEEGVGIVSLHVRQGGRARVHRETVELYGVLDGRLLAAPTAVDFLEQRRFGGGRLELGGDHPVAAELRRMKVSPKALLTLVERSGRLTMHAPTSVAAVAGARLCHAGLAGDRGRWTIRYPGTQAFDQYGWVATDDQVPSSGR